MNRTKKIISRFEPTQMVLMLSLNVLCPKYAKRCYNWG